MKEDFAKYSQDRKEFVQKWVLKNAHEEPSMAIAVMAQTTSVPCIIVAFWIGEVLNWPDKVKENVDSLIKFYGYTELLNKPEGPWGEI